MVRRKNNGGYLCNKSEHCRDDSGSAGVFATSKHYKERHKEIEALFSTQDTCNPSQGLVVANSRCLLFCEVGVHCCFVDLALELLQLDTIC